MSFLIPKQVLTPLHIMPGHKVADFGCGRGEYVFQLAEAVADAGIVYAVDIHKALLTKISKEAHEIGLKNIKTIWADVEQGGIIIETPEQTLDIAVVSNILFQLENKNALLVEINRILKQNGKVLVVEWIKDSGVVGPGEKQIMSQEDIEKLFKENNFILKQEVPAGSHHIAYIYSKK